MSVASATLNTHQNQTTKVTNAYRHIGDKHFTFTFNTPPNPNQTNMPTFLSLVTASAFAAIIPLGVAAQLAPDMYPDCASSDLTSWGTYICDIKNRPTKMAIAEGCLPQSYTATAAQVKGAVLLHHGFTACPDSQAVLAETLANEGFHVYVPLVVGHGRVHNNSCIDPDVTCSNGNYGDPIDEFPADDLIYNKHTLEMIKLFKEEYVRRGLVQGTHRAGVGGLSLGGPLVLDTLTQDSAENFFTHGFITNGFFGVTVPPVDRQVLVCLESSVNREGCLRSIAGAILDGLSTQFGNPDELPQKSAIDTLTQILVSLLPSTTIEYGYDQIQSLVRFLMTRASKELRALGPVADLLEETFSWGTECSTTQRTNGRNGYCTFKFSQLFAAHTFSQNAIVGSNRINKNVQLGYQIVQRDGPTRNALIVQSARTAESAGAKVGMCVYKMVGECDGSNECGVPHSCMSRVENEIVAPFELYWEKGLNGDIASFFANDTMPGVTGDPSYPKRDECDIISVSSRSQDPNIIGNVPVLSSLSFRISLDKLVLAFNATNTSNDITNVIRSIEAPWQVDVKDEKTAVSAEDDGSVTTVRVELVGAPMALHMEDMIEKGDLTTLAQTPVVSFQLDGRDKVSVPQPASVTGEPDWSGLGFFSAGAATVGAAGAIMYKVKSREILVPSESSAGGASKADMTSGNPIFDQQQV
jgi:pimeloyl-ACP methyl ester carboxylesterase